MEVVAAALIVRLASKAVGLLTSAGALHTILRHDKEFQRHAANERTFLAWVPTAIAVMAFGFLVERFDLFLQVTAPSLADRALSPGGEEFGNLAGFTLIILGTAMFALAAASFGR